MFVHWAQIYTCFARWVTTCRTPELAALLKRHVASLSRNAVVIGCHWLGYSADHVIGGEEVHAVIQSAPTLTHQYGEQHGGLSPGPLGLAGKKTYESSY